MKRGVVLSINKRFVTLLTPEGEFLKTKRQSRPYKVGEEISFSCVKPKFTFSFSTLHLPAKKTVVFSLASSFLILISVLPSLFTEHVSAYMTFDVNPSIELELNDELEVLKLTGLNRDGELVIKEISNWKGKNVKIVTNRIVNTTKRLGYMEGKKQIVVSTTLLDDDKELDKNLKAEIKKVSKQENFAQTNLKVIPATKNDRDKAKEQGISTGKFVEEKLDKETKEVKEQVKETQVESSITSKKSNRRQNEFLKKEMKNQAAEQKQKAIKSLKSNEKINEKKVQSHEQKQKVTMSKENEIKKKQVKKEKSLKQQRQKDKALRQQEQKGKSPKQQRQKDKATRQQEQKEYSPKQQRQNESVSRQQEQKGKSPKQPRQKEKLSNNQKQKGKSPKQQPKKEKVSKHQVQKDEAAKQHPQRKNEPKQNPRGSQFDHKDIRNK